jgi:hypothetical protein
MWLSFPLAVVVTAALLSSYLMDAANCAMLVARASQILSEIF